MNEKELAKILYCEGGLEQKRIAQIIGVTEKTIGVWKSDGEWDLTKSTSAQINDTAMRIVWNIYKRTEELTKQDAFDASELSKLAQAKEKFMPKGTDYDSFVRFSSELMLFLKEKHPDQLHQMADIFRHFAATKFNYDK